LANGELLRLFQAASLLRGQLPGLDYLKFVLGQYLGTLMAALAAGLVVYLAGELVG